MESMPKIRVVSFYKFVPVPAERVESLAQEIEQFAESIGLRGLMILSAEGMNTTLSGSADAVEAFLNELRRLVGMSDFDLKESWVEDHPFRIFRVKVREEIVTIGAPGLVPNEEVQGTHLSPEEWHRLISEDPDVVLLDTRNWYETQIGKFQGAIAPPIEEFREFPEYLSKAGIPKDKKVLIYCTGGIRCEKAIFEMKKQGYDQSYQLDGGILAYLEKFPNQKFDGECFVFDHRVAVDQNLQPSKTFSMCPHCGQPANDISQCVRCDSDTRICPACKEKGMEFLTCSKNCMYHFKLAPGKKGRKQFRDSAKKPARFLA